MFTGIMNAQCLAAVFEAGLYHSLEKGLVMGIRYTKSMILNTPAISLNIFEENGINW